MKPLHLELYGFGAFAEPCKISFTDWQDGEVFLITGETGAERQPFSMRFVSLCMERRAAQNGNPDSSAVNI